MNAALAHLVVLTLSTAVLAAGPANEASPGSTTAGVGTQAALNLLAMDRSSVDDRVEAYSSNYYTLRVRRGEHVDVWGRGDGDTDLDLYVFDPSDRLVASDEGYTDSMSVSFEARRSGTYTIQVRNLGSVWNAFTLKAEH